MPWFIEHKEPDGTWTRAGESETWKQAVIKARKLFGDDKAPVRLKAYVNGSEFTFDSLDDMEERIKNMIA